MSATIEQHAPAALTEIADYPFEFLLEERYSISDAMSLVVETYQEVECSEQLPPSLGAIVDHLSGWWFAAELMFRAYYRDDICWNVPGDVKRDIEDFIADYDGDFGSAIEEYTWDQLDGGQTFNIHDIYGDLNEFGEWFMNDMEYLLNASNLFFIQVDYEDHEQYTEHRTGRLPNHRELRLHNCPIVEVW